MANPSVDAAPTRSAEPSTVLAIVGVSALVIAILGGTYTYSKYRHLSHSAGHSSTERSLVSEELENLKAELESKRSDLQALESTLQAQRESIQAQISEIEKSQEALRSEKEKSQREIEIQSQKEHDRLTELIQTRSQLEEKRIRDLAKENQARLDAAEARLRERMTREESERTEVYNKKLAALAKQKEDLENQRQNPVCIPNVNVDASAIQCEDKTDEDPPAESTQSAQSTLDLDLDQIVKEEDQPALAPIDLSVDIQTRARSTSMANPDTTPSDPENVKKAIPAVKFADGINSPMGGRHKRNKSFGDFSQIEEDVAGKSKLAAPEVVERKRGGSHIVRKTSTNSLFSEASNCANCNRSIFGSPMVTPKGERFHPRCFVCLTCKKPIKGAYHPAQEEEGEWNCEDCHARNNIQKPNFLLKKGK